MFGSKAQTNDGSKRAFKLLIVDDSNIMRRRIERSQQFEALEVVGSAGNGVDALEIFKKTDPDVVTMDLTMPRMDGIECIGKIVALKPAGRSRPWRKARTAFSTSPSPTDS
jgi:two-component system chemotaxis response regulator CheY